MPINAYVIEHRDGLVLFDTGLDPAIASDPNYISSSIGRFLLQKIFRLHIGPDDVLGNRLEALNLSASDVCKVVISHLHFDHVGGIADVPEAELLVSKTEWEQLSTPHPEREWILREHIERPGAKWQPIEFEAAKDPLLAPFGGCHDVMGDQSMMLLPTPGHTPGSMSMLVRQCRYATVAVGRRSYLRARLVDEGSGAGNWRRTRPAILVRQGPGADEATARSGCLART